jgi:hypothetical protein
MVHKSVSALIDEAIWPAVLIVSAKILGVFAVNFFFNSSWMLSRNAFFGLPAVTYFSLEEFLLTNSLSNALMFVVISLGTSLVIVRAHFFHASHISPQLHARLLRLRLSVLLVETFKIYHQAAIWLAFLWLATILLIFQSIFNLSSPILAIVAFLVTVNFSWFLASDIQREIIINKKERYL